MTKKPYTIGLAIMAIVLSIRRQRLEQAAKKTDQPTVEGRWTGRITGTPHGDMAMGLALKQDGKKVTGTLTTEHTGDIAGRRGAQRTDAQAVHRVKRRDGDRVDRHAERRWIAAG